MLTRDERQAKGNGGLRENTEGPVSLNVLIRKIERICIGFDDHKQEVFNLVQALKTLFLYTQGEKDGAEEYGRNFRSLWNMVEAFRGSPRIHKGLVDALLANASKVHDVDNLTRAEHCRIKEDACVAVEAALLIRRADKFRYRKLKDELVNSYLLGTYQYLDTYHKALRILGNYQTSRQNLPFRSSPNNTGVAFLQQGGGGGCERDRFGKGTRTQETTTTGADAGGGASNVARMVTGASGAEGTKTNSCGESHCFSCTATTHWAYKCP